MHNHTHFFETNNTKYALDWKNILFLRLNNDADILLKQCLNGDIDLSTTPFARFFQHNYFVSQQINLQVPHYHYQKLNISFAPVQDCNLACTYCYAKSGKYNCNHTKKFDIEMINRLIDYIYFEKYGDFKKYKFDFVSGGEPLLDVNILEYFLNRIRKIDNDHSKKTTVLIVTNGTLLSSKIISMLDKYDVFLGISIDGSREIHNAQRKYKNGNGTYDDIVNGISILQQSNVSEKIKSPWAMSVITPNTGSLINVMESCVKLGFKRMQMQLLRVDRDHPLRFQNKDIEKLKNHYKELFEHIIEHTKNGDLSRLKMIANDNDSFGKYLKRLLLRKPVFYRCFAGRNKISISPDGLIYPCDSFCGKKEYVIGSIYENLNVDSTLQLFHDLHVQNRSNCSSCWARFLCGGDCYHNSYEVNKSVFIPDEFTCIMNKFFIENAIALLDKIYSINNEYILYLTKFLSIMI